ncbi:MAG: hypothetical protein ACT4ON_12570 [Bacteroidota bacterium]
MKKIQQVLLISFLFLAIAFDNATAQCTIGTNSTTSGSTGISATSLTISHTVSGSNTILIVRASTRNGDPTSITYNSVSLTKLATKNNSSQYASIWYLINPSAGTNNVVINGSSGFAPIIGITSFTGVHQTAPFGTVVSAAFSSNPSLNVSSASGELIIDVVNANTSMTVGSGQTQQYNLHEFVSDGSGSTEAGASSVTMSWSGFSPDGAHIAVPLKPCAGALTVSAGADKTICNGTSVAIGGNPTATGGTSPYTYSWTPTNGLGSTNTNANPTASPNNTKTYTVTVTDNVGATATDVMVVTVNDLPVANAGGNKDLCTGSSVAIGGSPTGSGGSSPYTYVWSPSTALSSTTVANPNANPTSNITYTVVVTDNNGCSAASTAAITIYSLPTASAGSNKTTCSGSPVSIGGSPTASGGTSPYTYSWSPTTALSSSTAANPNASPTATTNYTVTVTDNKGCSKAASMSVTVNPLPTASAGPDKTICTGSSTSIGGSPTASGGDSPYTYSWSPTTGLSSSTNANPTANPSTTTSYTVTITDFKGCTHTDVVIVNVNPLPTADAGTDITIYEEETTTIGGSPTASGGSSPYTYVWAPSSTLSSSTVSNPDATPTSTTNYTVTVTDNNGCTKKDVISVTVNPAPSPTTYTVTSTANGTTTDGVSLRWAITKANLSAGNSIAFNIPGAVPHTITLTSALPVITKHNITIDGCTQPANGYTGASPKIIIDGNNTIPKGIEIYFSKDSVEIYCLYIKGFTDNAIYIPGHENHIIGASGKGNVISGNGNASTDAAIYIKGGTIKGNIIGMDVTGTSAEANTGYGIYANGGLVTIGSGTSTEGNLISANTSHGIYLNNTDNSVIKGNKIGTNADGSADFGNGGSGIHMTSSSLDINIGGSAAGEGNLISGNTGDGIYNSDGNGLVIRGNKIGTNAAGTAAIGNTGNGIYIAASGNNAIIGGNTAEKGNLVSGNGANGITIVDGPNASTIKGNKIGTDVNGTQNLGNTGYGIFLAGSTTQQHTIGGTSGGDGNIIAFNGNSGVGIDAGGGITTDENTIQRNSIFCNASSGNQQGINLINNGNDGIAKPVITSANATSVSGTSVDNATIEIFKDEGCAGCQGKTYIGTTTANGSGNWSFTGTLSGNITATATTSTKGTSQFANCVFSATNLSASAGADKNICIGSSTSIGGAPTATGGTSPYSYTWTPSTGLSSTTIANPNANPTTSITYTVTVTDNDGITAVDAVFVTVNSLPTVSISPSADTICKNDSTTLTASGASTYSWSPATGLSASTGASVIAKPIITTNYTVTGTDANGCTNVAVVTVNVPCAIISINTAGLDSLYLPDTLTYTISGAGLSGTYEAGSSINFSPTLPLAGSTSTITLAFSDGSEYQAMDVLIDLNPEGGFENLRVRPGGSTGSENACSGNVCSIGDIGNGSLQITPCVVLSCFTPTPIYAVLKRELDAGFYIVTNGQLKFQYDEEYNTFNNKLKFNIYNRQHLVVASNVTMPLASQPPVVHGDNRYNINIANCNSTPVLFLGKGYYILEVINEKNEKRYLRFKHNITLNNLCTGSPGGPGEGNAGGN